MDRGLMLFSRCSFVYSWLIVRVNRTYVLYVNDTDKKTATSIEQNWLIES